MRNSVDIIVIGAGIVGASAARALASAGRRVLVLRRGAGIGEASPAAAGMLAAQVESHDELLLPLALAARARHAALAGELAAAGYHVGHETGGILQVALDDAGATALEVICASHQAAGLAAEYIPAQDLAGRMPGLSGNTRGAMLAPDEGRVNNAALATALMRDAVKRGAMVEFAAADTIVVEHGRVVAVKTSAGDRRTAAVLIAAGAWSPTLKGLPRQIPVTPVRGQIVRTSWPAALARRTVFGPDAYIVPRGDDALLGSTMESVGYDPKVTAEGTSGIAAAAARLVPALAALPVLEAWAGLRPMTPDQRPILGLDPDVAGLAWATGHGRNGVLLGPLTAELVAQLLLTGESSWDLRPYGVERFSHSPRPTPHAP